MRNPLDYDPAALKAASIKRHGSVLGAIVFDAAVSRRQAEDARAAEINSELLAVRAEITALSQAAGERRAKAQLRLAADYAAYMKLCDEEAQLDSVDQSRIAPLTERCRNLQTQMRNIVQPRLNERELQDLVTYNSTDAEMRRSFDAKVPPLNSPPPSDLARINASVGLNKPRP